MQSNVVIYVAFAGCSFEKYIKDHRSSQSVPFSSTAPAYQLYSPVSKSHTVAGKCDAPTITTNKTESYSTIPYSISSDPAAGQVVPSVLATSTTIPCTEKSIGTTSHMVPITVPSTTISDLTQLRTKEKSQVTDDNQQSIFSKKIGMDNTSE